MFYLLFYFTVICICICILFIFYILPFGKDTMREKVIEIKNKKGVSPNFIIYTYLVLPLSVLLKSYKPINKR